MNKEEQRIAIAILVCGMIGPFENHEEWFENGDSDGWIIVLRDATGKRVANYLNDLNAMHEAEKVLTIEQQRHYAEELGRSYDGSFLHVTASADQRAKALLKALNLWKNA
jgi:hypothetical protein